MPETAAKRRNYARGAGNPDPVDVHVGRRIRERRLFLGLKQPTVGEAMGLTLQQIQKYEVGASRVSASRLSELAGVLKVSVSYFFEEMEAKAGEDAPYPEPETIELVRRYYAIPDPEVRGKFLELVKAAAQADR